MISLALTPALAKSGDLLGKNSAVIAVAAAEGPAESRPPALLRAAEDRRRQASITAKTQARPIVRGGAVSQPSCRRTSATDCAGRVQDPSNDRGR